MIKDNYTMDEVVAEIHKYKEKNQETLINEWARNMIFTPVEKSIPVDEDEQTSLQKVVIGLKNLYSNSQ